VHGYLRASEHGCAVAMAGDAGGKRAAKLSSVATGSGCASHLPTSTCTSFLHECDALPAQAHEPLPLTSQGAACRSLQIKTHPLPSVPVRHQRHLHSRMGFYEPFINTVHFLGD